MDQALVSSGHGFQTQMESPDHERGLADLRLTAKQVAVTLAIFDKETLKILNIRGEQANTKKFQKLRSNLKESLL